MTPSKKDKTTVYQLLIQKLTKALDLYSHECPTKGRFARLEES